MALAAVALVMWKLGGGVALRAEGAGASRLAGSAGNERAASAGARDRAAGRPSRPAAEEAVPASGPALTRHTLRVLRNPDPIQRSRDFLRILDAATPETYDDVFAAWSELRFSGTQLHHEESMMNHRAGALLGRGALGHRLGSARDLTMMGPLRDQYAGWVRADPVDAKRWLEELPEGRYRRDMTMTYLGNIALVSPDQALAEAAAMSEDMQIAAGGSIIGRVRYAESVDAASDLILRTAANHPEAPIVRGMFETLVHGTLDGDGSLGASIIERHLGAPYVPEALVARVAAIRLERDPDPVAALDWLSEVESDSSLLHGRLAHGVESMSEERLRATADWLGRQTEFPNSEPLLNRAWQRLAEMEAAAADP